MKFKSNAYTQVSGSVGGSTFSHNSGGMYVRARTIPVDPQTAAQQVVRGFLAVLASAWQNTLTAIQRDAWTLYGLNVPLPDSLGDPTPVKGLPMYIRCNLPRLQAGMARVDDGPTIFSMPPNFQGAVVAAEGDPAAITYTWTALDEAWDGELGAALLTFTSRQMSPTINFFKGPFRTTAPVLGAAVAITSPQSRDSDFSGTAANIMYVRTLVTRADGRLSAERIFRQILQP